MGFKFKQFEITQDANPHKIGTDSMLLGAWVAQKLRDAPIERILDIGTGTGILSLMLAQSFPNSQVTAIEPNDASLIEASTNFSSSPFADRILGIHAALQNFGAIEKFDLIICNPPYFDGTYLSESNDRNNARHTLDLPVHELYENAEDLLTEEGKMAVVIPQSEIKEHLERAFDNDLFLQEILHSLRADGKRKRAFMIFGKEEVDPVENEMIVKDQRNKYSKRYIELTKDFYLHDLSAS